MKNTIIILLCVFSSLSAQDSLVFKNIITLDTNPIESQGKTGTCWSYATVSFLESELIRMGRGEYNLSEMFVARNVYLEKANNFVRRHGKTNFGEGSLSHDLINTIDKYGLVPNNAFNGLVLDAKKHDHSELSSILDKTCISNGESSPVAFANFDANLKSSTLLAPRESVVMPLPNKNLYAISKG